MAVLVDADHLTVRRSDRALFEDLSATVADGERLGVVGINGTGKSTLLSVLAGTQTPDEGVVRRGRGARVGYLDQQPVLAPGTVGAAVGEGWEARAALERLGMGPFVDTDVAELSGGQAKRVALARLLADPAELLILDEPTNHLDIVAASWLGDRLRQHRGGLLLVTHDRHLLDTVSTRILELDRGRAYLHEGGYEAYLAARLEREARAEQAEDVRLNLARRELAWLRRGAPARSRKPQARVDAAKKLLATRPDAPARRGELTLGFGTPRLGDQVIELEQVGFAYRPGAPNVLEGADLALDPRDRLGVVGPNGTGKSTLLDLLAGRKSPTSGRVVTGPTVVVGYYDQGSTDLDPDGIVREIVAGPTRVPGTPEDNALLERFWFGGALAFAPVRTLSGGERRRLQLLVVLAQRPNVLLLDEPTNDLDIDTLRALEDYLEEWPGALVTVSHDRAFLARATERLVAVDERGRVEQVVGGLDAWLARTDEASAAGRRRGTTAPTDRAKPAGGDTRAPRSDGDRPAKGRSASTLGFRMRELERAMARHERDRDRLQAELAGATDHAVMARVGGELAGVMTALGEAEEAWLALAEEAEANRAR